ncbi:MAG: FKBP-type peptidyl-prolyl cis-trans isomerase [Candidatus Latescibacterota bacterium]|nr:FKBP-type peptidyl-prolyl cis-trans isomerase [Candidatus Latescibacterota bacterium]
MALVAVLSAIVMSCSDPCATADVEAVLAKAAAEPGAVRTESGLVFRQLKPGYGPQPSEDNLVSVHYEGKLLDGTVFDSSVKRGRPSDFRLNEVIPGWTEGLQMLKGGGKAKLTIPPGLAYGEKGARSKIPGCSVLIFEVELLGIYD